MSSQPTCYNDDWTSSERELLAQLLSFNPGYPINTDASWLHDQAHLISTFPLNLLAPRGLIPRLIMSLPFSSSKAKLCSTHKRLNSHLIHQIFLGVTAECTSHLERFLEADQQLPMPVRALFKELQPFVRRLQAVNGLWMTPKFYRTLFMPWDALPTDFRFERIESGCEACILASVGGNHQLLSDLRASIRGRKKRGHSHAAILQMVEAWIDWTGRSDTIREESDKLGKEFAKCRREMQKVRRGKMVFATRGSLDSNQDCEKETLIGEGSVGVKEKKDDEDDFEGSIIDFYAKRMSTASPINRVRTTEGLHEAFRGSIVLDPIRGTFDRVGQEGVRSYLTSFYRPKPSATSQDRRSSERIAQSYQNLLEIPENDDIERNTESIDLQGKEHSFI